MTNDKQRERLVELLEKHCAVAECKAHSQDCTAEDCASCLADYLLANGVLVPPCKVGIKVFLLRSLMNDVIEGEITSIKKTEFSEGYTVVFLIDDNRYSDVPFSAYGKTVFLSREEAEAKLKEGVQ